ncbi:MAG TPA: sulfatase [Arachidicoccus sp.]|nr:sulfatase [Arachidicoccus sp.]
MKLLKGGIYFLLLLCLICLQGRLSAQKSPQSVHQNTQQKAPQRPNIILFIADDLNQQDLGCYGNRDVRTPNMDLLAKEGLQFTSAYAASSMCTPSRSALFTGLYPYKNGSQMNHFTVRPKIGSLPAYLQKLGYRVVISGKIDVFPLDNFPFEVIGREFGKYAPTENRIDRKKETVQLIHDHFATQSRKPLCLIVAPWLPHVPWFPHKDFDPAKIQVPKYLADTKATRSAIASYYQSIAAADQMLGEVLRAVDKAGQKDNTVMMFTADQGAQFPGAKWTVYNRGLNVPLLVRWPGKIAAGTKSDALISLVDITPTFIDLAGGSPVKGLDGKSFKGIIKDNNNGNSSQKGHHDYIFAETSVEPHYWYNYTPARSIITATGWHYIKNYHPGRRFITHIDKVEQNEYYFDTWICDAEHNPKTKFLLDRYTYRPPEELYNLNQDKEEFKNLAVTTANKDDPEANNTLINLRALLQKELARQGEKTQMIMDGPLPKFADNSYTILQNKSASDLSFNRHRWNPDTLYISAYLDDIQNSPDRDGTSGNGKISRGAGNGGIVCDYFGNFKLFAYDGKLGLQLSGGKVIESSKIGSGENANKGQLLLKLTAQGDLEISFNGQSLLCQRLDKDLTKIKSGYVTCGKLQGQALKGRLQPYDGKIQDLTFTMNTLSTAP